MRNYEQHEPAARPENGIRAVGPAGGAETRGTSCVRRLTRGRALPLVILDETSPTASPVYAGDGRARSEDAMARHDNRERQNGARVRVEDSPLPLRYRLPNPPIPFSGRGRDLERIDQALKKRPLVILRGGEGVGKTSLACELVHGRHADRAASTLYVAVRPTAPPEDVRLILGRAMFRGGALDETKWSSGVADPEGLGAHCLDVAEAADLWIVIDDATSCRPTPRGGALAAHLSLRAAQPMDRVHVGRFVGCGSRRVRDGCRTNVARRARCHRADTRFRLGRLAGRAVRVESGGGARGARARRWPLLEAEPISTGVAYSMD